MTQLTVYVPAEGSQLAKDVAPGSAIVGDENSAVTVLVDYEGNLYGATNLHEFDVRLEIAAGRHVEKYPTTARRAVPKTSVQAVATYDYESRQLEPLNGAAAMVLGEWVNAYRRA